MVVIAHRLQPLGPRCLKLKILEYGTIIFVVFLLFVGVVVSVALDDAAG
jgi:hypothetical protein